MLKLDPFFLQKLGRFGLESVPYFVSSPPFIRDEGIHFSWKVDNFLSNRKGKVAHILRAETSSFFFLSRRSEVEGDAHIACEDRFFLFSRHISRTHTPRAFVHLEFTTRHGRAHALSGGVYPLALC